MIQPIRKQNINDRPNQTVEQKSLINDTESVNQKEVIKIVEYKWLWFSQYKDRTVMMGPIRRQLQPIRNDSVN